MSLQVSWSPRVTGPVPTSTVVVLFPTRERLLDAAWRLLTAVDDLKKRGALDPDKPIVACMSRYEQLRPELYLSPAAYDLASSITIRMRDTEAGTSDGQPEHCVVLIDTRA